MTVKEQMFIEVENWIDSGLPKMTFLENKPFSPAKFNYWLAKWKASQEQDICTAGFREMGFAEVKLGKVLEIEAPSGVKITVFA